MFWSSWFTVSVRCSLVCVAFRYCRWAVGNRLQTLSIRHIRAKHRPPFNQKARYSFVTASHWLTFNPSSVSLSLLALLSIISWIVTNPESVPRTLIIADNLLGCLLSIAPKHFVGYLFECGSLAVLRNVSLFKRIVLICCAWKSSFFAYERFVNERQTEFRPYWWSSFIKQFRS